MVFTSFCGCIFYIEANGGGTHVTDLYQLNDLTKVEPPFSPLPPLPRKQG